MPEVVKANTRQKSQNEASASGNVTCPTSSSSNRRRILPLVAGRPFESLEAAPDPSLGSKVRTSKNWWESNTNTSPRKSPGHSLLTSHPSSSPNQPLRRTLPLPMSAKKSIKTAQLLTKSPSNSGVNSYAKVRKSVSLLASSSAKKPSPVRNSCAKSPQVTKSPVPSKTKSSAHSPYVKSPQKKQKVAENGTASNPVDIEDVLFDVDSDSDDEIEIIDASEAAVNVVQVVQKNTTGDDDEIMVVGHVNHVELPHLRQHCTAFPFDEDTPSVNDIYAQSVVTVNMQSCPLCYCYACDCPAKDCSKWHSEESGKIAVNHCCATEKLDLWVQRRKQNHKATVAAKKKRKSPCLSSGPDNIIAIDDSDPEDIFTG